LVNDVAVSLAVQILLGFAEAVRKNGVVQVIADGSDSNTAMIALGYVAQIATSYGESYAKNRLLRITPELVQKIPSVSLAQRPWYNEGLNSRGSLCRE